MKWTAMITTSLTCSWATLCKRFENFKQRFRKEKKLSESCEACSTVLSPQLKKAIHSAQREMDDFNRQVAKKCQKKRSDGEI